MEASQQQNKSRIELFDNEERVKLIEDVLQILWDPTDKKQKSKARYKRRRSFQPEKAQESYPSTNKTALRIRGKTDY
ncbi:hypothetical protein ACLKA7_000121 [Drosophila subpalustris]